MKNMNTTASPTSRLTLLQRHRYAASFFALLLSVSGLAAAETMIVGQPPNAGAEATIRALEVESSRAVMARDYATLERLWSERFVVNAPNNQIFASRAAVFEVFRNSSADLYSSYEKTIECIAFDADVALVMGVETVTAVGSKRPAQRRYTNVWRFVSGAWRLIARQATMVPVEASVSGVPTAK
jgi:ketosteroid isomerase-like protein